MKILVTGGAGFIGSHTAEALLDRGFEVTILDNLTEPIHKNGIPLYLPEKARFIKGDVRSKADWIEALKDVEAVFHFAAYQDYLLDFSTFFQVNTTGTALLYEVIVEKQLPVKKVIVASSQAVYGEGKYTCTEHGLQYPHIRLDDQLSQAQWELICPSCGRSLTPMWTDESRVNPQNQYGMSKYAQELAAINLGKRYCIPTACLRYSIVQGARQSFYNTYSGAMRIFCLNLFFDKAPTIYEDGGQIRDYINIKDVVEANLLMLNEEKADYGVFNVGGGHKYTVRQFFDKVADVFGKDLKPVTSGEYRFGDTRHIFSAIEKIRHFGWAPRIPIEQSIKEYKAFIEEQTDLEDILDFQKSKMKDMDVVRSINPGSCLNASPDAVLPGE